MADISMQNIVPSGIIELVSASQIVYKIGWMAPPRVYTSFSLRYALAGSGAYCIGDELYTIRAGECIWIPESFRTSMLPIEGEPFRTLSLSFRIFDPILRQQMMRVIPSIKVDQTMESILMHLLINRNVFDSYARWRSEAFSVTLLNLISPGRITSGSPDSSFVLVNEYSPATKKLLTYLEANFYQEHSAETLGQALGYNKNYLSAVFSRDTGHSIRDYINFHRARLAVVFSFFWAVGITETYETLRFNSLSHFSRTFKKFVGIPPSAFFRGCSLLSAEERSSIAGAEPILSYRPMLIDDLFASLRHLGETMEEVLKQKAQQSASNNSDLSES